MKPERLLIVLVLSLLLAGCGFSLAADITPPPGSQIPTMSAAQPTSAANLLHPLLPPDPAAGEAIYIEKCASCHGERGMGDGEKASSLPNPVTAIGSPEVASRAAPAQWFMVVSQGNLERRMPPFPSLNDRQRWDVIAYTYSLSTPAGSIEQAKVLYAENCAGCHGPMGKGDGPQAAGMSSVMKDFTDQEFMAGQPITGFYQAISDGVSPSMPGFASLLSEQERWDLANYLRWLTFSNQGQPAPAQDVPAATSSAPEQGVAPVSAITPTLTVSPTQILGVVTGLVTNGSGGELPAGAEVTLHGFDEMQMVISSTTTLSPEGAFTFPGIETLTGRAFFATLTHAGVTYGSELVTADSEGQQIELPISVFDTTTETKDLKVDRLHLFFEPIDEQNIRVAELYIISNAGNKTVMSAEPGQPSLSFDLPQGATDLRFQDGELGGRFIQTEEGFGDLFPIYPGAGSHQILLDYAMPYNHKLELAQAIDLPVEAIVIMVPQNTYKVKGESLEPASNREVQGVSFDMYNRGGLAAGDELNLTVSGRPSGALLSSSSNNSLVIGLGALGVVLLLLGGWFYLRSRKQNESEADDGVDAETPAIRPEPAETLMDAILALDDQHQAGELPEDAYIQRRETLKAQLKAQMDKKQGN